MLTRFLNLAFMTESYSLRRTDLLRLARKRNRSEGCLQPGSCRELTGCFEPIEALCAKEEADKRKTSPDKRDKMIKEEDEQLPEIENKTSIKVEPLSPSATRAIKEEPVESSWKRPKIEPEATDGHEPAPVRRSSRRLNREGVITS